MQEESNASQENKNKGSAVTQEDNPVINATNENTKPYFPFMRKQEGRASAGQDNDVLQQIQPEIGDDIDEHGMAHMLD